MGIMIAVGLRKIKMQLIMAAELFLIGLTGASTGILMGLPLLIYFFFKPIRFSGEYEKLVESFGYEAILPFSLDPMIFIRQAIVVFIITLLLGLYPLNAIRKLKIAEAMRNN
jgi:ABC-type antimicrobial peptide transport system permease subunit